MYPFRWWRPCSNHTPEWGIPSVGPETRPHRTNTPWYRYVTHWHHTVFCLWAEFLPPGLDHLWGAYKRSLTLLSLLIPNPPGSPPRGRQSSPPKTSVPLPRSWWHPPPQRDRSSIPTSPLTGRPCVLPVRSRLDMINCFDEPSEAPTFSL